MQSEWLPGLFIGGKMRDKVLVCAKLKFVLFPSYLGESLKLDHSGGDEPYALIQEIIVSPLP